MRRAGRLAAEILDALVPHVVPGVTTQELDDIVHRMTVEGGGVPATLGYRGYTKSCCISINHVVCHGIPERKDAQGRRHRQHRRDADRRRLARGHQPHVPRRRRALKARKLVDVTYECLMLGIEQARPGQPPRRHRRTRSSATPKAHRYSVVRDFCGHGVGRLFHDAPEGRPCRPPRHRSGAQARNDLHRRADDQSRPPAT